MTTNTTDRLEAARDRLKAALLAGKDTAQHREAIALAEAAVAAAQQRKQDDAATAERSREARIATRIDEIVDEVADRIDDQFLPIPVFLEPTNE